MNLKLKIRNRWEIGRAMRPAWSSARSNDQIVNNSWFRLVGQPVIKLFKSDEAPLFAWFISYSNSINIISQLDRLFKFVIEQCCISKRKAKPAKRRSRRSTATSRETNPSFSTSTCAWNSPLSSISPLSPPFPSCQSDSIAHSTTNHSFISRWLASKRSGRIRKSSCSKIRVCWNKTLSIFTSLRISGSTKRFT